MGSNNLNAVGFVLFFQETKSIDKLKKFHMYFSAFININKNNFNKKTAIMSMVWAGNDTEVISIVASNEKV